MPDATIHASAVLTGDTAIVIRGPSGSGKSSLAFALILAGRAGQIAPCTLIGDDRVRLSRDGDAVTVHAVPGLEGLIEIHGLGIRRCNFKPQGVVGLVVDLQASDTSRMPEPAALSTTLLGIPLPRIPSAGANRALPIVLASLLTQPYGETSPRR